MSISYSIDRSNPAFGYETIKVAGQTSVILTRTYITQDQRYLFFQNIRRYCTVWV